MTTKERLKKIYSFLDACGGWTNWEQVLQGDDKELFARHLWVKERQKEPPCGLCAFCQEMRLLEYDDEDGHYIGPALKYMCVNKESSKVFTYLKHGALEFKCDKWEDINKGVRV